MKVKDEILHEGIIGSYHNLTGHARVCRLNVGLLLENFDTCPDTFENLILISSSHCVQNIEKIGIIHTNQAHQNLTSDLNLVTRF